LANRFDTSIGSSLRTSRRPPQGASLALVVASAGFGLVIMHTTAVNVALPAIHRGLGGTVAALQWCVNAYALGLAALLLPCGALADRYGARRTFLAGLGIFAAGGASCAAAPRLWLLVAGQGVAGVGAAMIAPASLSLIRETFPDARQRMHALGVLSLGLSAGFGAGPIVGGALVGALGWRAVFLVDVPCALALIAVVVARVPVSPLRPGRSIDVGGVLLGVLALGAVTFALTEGGNHGWTAPGVWWAAGLALLAGIGFVVFERSSRAPLLPKPLLASRQVRTASLVGLSFNFAVYGELFLLSLAFQRLDHASPFETGLLFFPQPVGTCLVATAVGRWLGRTGPRRPLLLGLMFSVASVITLLGFDQAPFPLAAACGLLMAGIAGGLLVPSLHVLVLVGTPAEVSGIAAASLNASRQIGGVLGVAVLGSMVSAGALASGVREALVLAGATQLATLTFAVLRRQAFGSTTPQASVARQPVQPAPSRLG
jgi:DHA2 family methylenomycin A resistance protein-like MFS transporter